jgi:hypothetical protein
MKKLIMLAVAGIVLAGSLPVMAETQTQAAKPAQTEEDKAREVCTKKNLQGAELDKCVKDEAAKLHAEAGKKAQ